MDGECRETDVSEYKELKLVVEGAWGKRHPQQATALFMERVRLHIELDSLPKKQAPHRKKRKREQAKATSRVMPPLMVEGEELIRSNVLARKLGIGDSTLRGWIGSGQLRVVRRQEGNGPKKVYLWERQVRDYIATKKRPQGRPRKER